jgi:hypothetical protein
MEVLFDSFEEESAAPSPAPKQEDVDKGPSVVDANALVPSTPEPTPAPAPTSSTEPAPEPEPELEEEPSPFAPVEVDEEPEVGEEEGDEGAAATPQPTPSVDPRDYSAFPDEVKDIVKKLPNALFNKHAKQISEWYNQAQMVKGKAHVFEHPESYLLDPEFRELQRANTQTNGLVNFWREQLIRVERGEPWQAITSYDQQGNPIIQDVPAPEDGSVDIDSKVRVMQYLQQLQTHQAQLKVRGQMYAASYEQRAHGAREQLSGIRQKLFSHIDLSKVDPDTNKQLHGVVSAFPPAVQVHPLMDFLKCAYVHVRSQAQAMDKLSKENKELKQKLQMRTKLPGSPKPVGKTTTGEKFVQFDEFE